MSVAYIAIRPECGCITGALVPYPGMRTRDIDAQVGQWVRSGRKVERLEIEPPAAIPVRACPHQQVPREQMPLQMVSGTEA